jgi:hypothetical protein
MASPIGVPQIGEALGSRSFPTIVLWNRLEGRPRTVSFNRALAAEVRDALWMLSRQWQLGELTGDDAASLVLAKVHVETSRLRKFRANGHAAQAFEDAVPFEAKVEQRPLPLVLGGRELGLDLRMLLGRHWLKLIKGVGNYRQAFLAAYPIEQPNPLDVNDADRVAHPDVWQTFAAVAGRLMDGGRLYLHLVAEPGNRAYDGIVVADADKPALDDRAQRFVEWFRRLVYQPAVTESAWDPAALEYRFECSAPDGEGEKVLTAEEYYHGRLDWFNVDIDSRSSGLGVVAGADPSSGPEVTHTLIPTQVEFEGMPNTRWWAFEDRKTNFGDVDASTTDLAKLLLIEFGLVYANDWFLVPFTLPVGSVADVRGIEVTNVFGERLWIEAAGSGSDEAWQRWSMFTLSVAGNESEPANTSLLLLPTVPKIQESDPIEEVVLVRDEIANIAWGVERTVLLPSGRSKPGAEAGYETLAFHQAAAARRGAGGTGTDPEPAARIRYRAMTSVPEHWIPFLPVHVDGSNREIQLQRGSMPRVLEGDPDPARKIQPRTTLLREGLDSEEPTPYFIDEEAVPRAGARVLLSYQRTRWVDGRAFVWLGVRKQAERGEAWSGLAFDQIVDLPPTES